MRVLVWAPPWIAQGDPLFYENALRRQLVPQANLLAKAGCHVTLLVGELLADRLPVLEAKVAVERIRIDECAELCGLGDPSVELYLRGDCSVSKRLEEAIRRRVPGPPDVILLWETPVPFLESLYPEALIVHQMPGAMSRPPFPNMVTFDPSGLYRRSTLATAWSSIAEGEIDARQRAVVEAFTRFARESVNRINPFSRRDLEVGGSIEGLVLLPLQVSGHYAFQADAGYQTQAELLFNVLCTTRRELGVVVTQYVTPRVSDCILNDAFVASVRRRWPNLVYQKRFDQIPGVSQYLLPFVDAVHTCSSSLGLQAALWNKSLIVNGSTFLKPLTLSESLPTALRDERLLAFMLLRQQPLVDVLLDNPDWFLRVLEDMLHRKRQGKTGVEALPDYTELIPGYRDLLIERFRVERAEREVGAVRPHQTARSAELARLERAMRDSGVRCISFDLFDTLVNRPVSAPVDVFKLLERAVECAGVPELPEFERIRQLAEVMTRESSEKDEITLSEIYDFISSHYKLGPDEAGHLPRIESRLELALCATRELGKAAWRLAKQTGKRVIVTTDTYLPRDTVSAILAKNGYEVAASDLFISSELGVRKREGQLFDMVAAALRMPASSVLHIGDHDISDVTSATARGLQSWQVIRSMQRLVNNPHYAKRLGPLPPHRQSLARSTVAALVAHRLFDADAGQEAEPSHFFGDPFNLGYAGLGPAVAGFMLWLGRQAQGDGVDKLYFLSREGWILMQVFDILHQGRPGFPRSQYLLASRRALRVAAIRSRRDALRVLAQPYADGAGTAVDFMQARFGIDREVVNASVLREAGFDSVNELVSASPLGQERLRRLVCSLEAAICERARIERTAYLAYLESVAIAETSVPAVVDLGWAGNMQHALTALTNRPFFGYYYATLHDSQRWFGKIAMRGYAGDGITPANTVSGVIQHRPLVEYLLCNQEASLSHFEIDDGSLRRVPLPEPDRANRAQLISRVHSGIVAFATDMRERLGPHLEYLSIEPSLAESTLTDYFRQPAAVDAEILRGHEFEDRFGGRAKRYLLAPGIAAHEDGYAESYWRAGAASLRGGGQGRRTVGPSNTRSNGLPGAMGGLSMAFENYVVKAATTSRKHAKYQRDRARFFEDSRSSVVRWWGRWTRETRERQ